jgi:hypothetical protein
VASQAKPGVNLCNKYFTNTLLFVGYKFIIQISEEYLRKSLLILQNLREHVNIKVSLTETHVSVLNEIFNPMQHNSLELISQHPEWLWGPPVSYPVGTAASFPGNNASET